MGTGQSNSPLGGTEARLPKDTTVPSDALQNLEARLKEIDQLLTAHAALTRLRRAELAIGRAGGGLKAVAEAVNLLVTPPTRGRPGQVEALNKASVALLS